ncbi:MAG: histidine phosphatase family protein [Burkholderiaceae bacterium]|jgi:phosphohistidine phosphatase|nr:histidine phosphatase family protein [Burkholderiaceae bacterium]MEB2318930.1 histidine phosphatase family protein [Pseudomonadota bacterium]
MSRHVVIWRHADAGDPAPGRDADFARPLSPAGRAQAAGVGRWLASRLPAPLRVLSSPAPRARQTAAALAPDPVIERLLEPDSSLDAYGRVLEQALVQSRDTIVLVGHQPFVGGLAGRLLGVGDIGLAVAKAGCWCFRSRGGGTWRLDVVMHPDFVEPIDR